MLDAKIVYYICTSINGFIVFEFFADLYLKEIVKTIKHIVAILAFVRSLMALTLALLLLSLDLFAQTNIPTDSLSIALRKTKTLEQKIKECEMIEDSLREAFYKEPAIITLSFEKNNEKIALCDDYDFWIENKCVRISPKLYAANQYLTDSISDTIALIFTYKNDTIRFSKIGYSWIKNGASLSFGVIENLEEIRKVYQKRKRDEDFNENIDLGDPYLRLLKNKKLKRLKRKIGKILFVVIAPRTYGDGAMMEIVTIKAK